MILKHICSSLLFLLKTSCSKIYIGRQEGIRLPSLKEASSVFDLFLNSKNFSNFFISQQFRQINFVTSKEGMVLPPVVEARYPPIVIDSDVEARYTDFTPSFTQSFLQQVS